MRSFAACIVLFLIADLIHAADGHRCDKDCPYPWGKRRPFSGLVGEEDL
jgi:hypothetical protein